MFLERVFFRFKEGTSSERTSGLLREVAQWPGVFGVPSCSRDASGADGKLIYVSHKGNAAAVVERLSGRDEVQHAEVCEPVDYSLGCMQAGMLSVDHD